MAAPATALETLHDAALASNPHCGAAHADAMLMVLCSTLGAVPGAFLAGSFVLAAFGLATRPWGDIDVYVPTGQCRRGSAAKPS